MANYINKYTNIEAYNADDGKQYPNVSYLIEQDIIKWEKNDPVHIVAVYNVTSTSEATKLLDSTTGITYQIIDDVKQDTAKDTYTFDTLGEHTVKYKLDGTSIETNAFENCGGLTNITIPNSVISIGYHAFQGCSGLTSVTIPNSVTSIKSYAFSGCRGLTSVEIPDSVTKISGNTFFGCRSLTSVKIHNSVTSIGDYAFSGCSRLTSVTIPNSVTKIEGYAFENCRGLTSITIEATTPPTLGGTTAFFNTNNCPIYVPAESLEAYVQATNWSALASRIQPIVA